MLCKRPPPTGFSLIELLIVIAVVGVIVGLVMPSSEPNLHEQLRGAAEILKTDLAYARSLAVTNTSQYQVTFEPDENRYVLRHSGSNEALDTLADSPFRAPGDDATQHVVDFDELPQLASSVRLVAAAEYAFFFSAVDDVEFGPLGETTRSDYTVVWLGAGSGDDARYVWLLVHPITGLTAVGSYTDDGPPAGVLGAASP